MGILSNIIQRFTDPSIPVGGKIWKMSTKEFNLPLKYDYDTIEKLLEDERIYSIVALVSSMVQKAYVGPELHPSDRYTDNKISEDETKALNAAIQVSRDLEFPQLCFNYAWQLVTHGDLFEKIVKNDKGITGLVSLPLDSTRVLANEFQKKQRGQGAQITEEKLITVKKTTNDSDPTVYKEGEYFHLSFKNHAVWRKDIEDTDTYGIYSYSPIASLQRLVNWKKKTIENDIIWKNKLLPRILYKLKMPSIIPSKYTGTQTEKVASALKDATLLTDKFINSTRTLRPDDDIVMSDAADAKMLEASSVNYHQPNETISQINTFLNTPQGVPSGLLGGETGASMGLELASIFAGIRVDYIVKKILGALNKIMQSHVRIVASSSKEEVISRLFIHSDPSLTVEKFNKVNTALSMAATGQFTRAEIREASGHVRLPQLPEEAFVRISVGESNKSINDQVGNIEQEKTKSNENNLSPQAKRNATEDQK